MCQQSITLIFPLARVQVYSQFSKCPISINFNKRSWLNNWQLAWPSSESAGDADEVSLLSPDQSQKIKGHVSASGVVVSVKDGRVLSRHLEPKQTFSTGYRNANNTNT